MRILIATPCLPWPLNCGGNAAQFSTLKCLELDHDFTLVCPVYDETAIAEARQLQTQLPKVKVRAIYCGHTPPPTPGLSIRIAKKVVKLGRRFLSDSQPEVQAGGEEALKYPFNPLPAKLILALRDELSKGVDLCQAEFAEMLPLGAWLPREIPKLFIHHQIHFVYARRFLETHPNDSYLSYLKAVMETQELAYLQNFDGVVTFSDQDRQALLAYVAPDKLFTSPFPIPADVAIARDLPSAFDGRFLIVASEEHAPNRDALEWLLEGIWPEILRQFPQAKLVVVGKWSEAAQARFAGEGVVFTGFVTDLSATLRAGIMLVPLRIGSGIRVKILVAMALGVPVVTTSVGSEGMLLRDGQEILVRDTESDFATAAVQLSRNPELWRRLAASGKAAVFKHYSSEGVRQRRNEIYANLARPAERVVGWQPSVLR
ncbi:MAG TPA: glycosyltransferase [Candidatus Baltobacteraceae bacterium]|jgi:glycosyltransferase involved in cell wall biosynthesis|nr:glycosyltransferase [Candidatus Baltobacteraceae bacterium]